MTLSVPAINSSTAANPTRAPPRMPCLLGLVGCDYTSAAPVSPHPDEVKPRGVRAPSRAPCTHHCGARGHVGRCRHAARSRLPLPGRLLDHGDLLLLGRLD